MKLPAERAVAQVPMSASALWRGGGLRAANLLVMLALLGCMTQRASAHVTPIYRCGNTYSQWPCPNATTVPLDTAPTAAEQAGSVRTAAMQARWADRLQAERVAAERRNRPALAGSLGPMPANAAATPRAGRSSAKHKVKATPETDRDFIAHVPATAKHRTSSK